MQMPPASLVALVRLLRRDGLRFPVKCARYAFSADAWGWLLRGGRHLEEETTSVALPAPVPEEEDSDDREASRRLLRDWNPAISVVVTSYNYAHLIRETLDALLAQTYRNFEVLVVDNGSSDGSPDIIREYAARDSRFRLLQHEGGVNRGLPASVKLGAEESRGEWVAFCEADDLWTPDHLEKKVGLLRDHWGEPDFIYNDIEPFGDRGRCRDFAAMEETRRPMLARVRNRIPPEAFRSRNWIFTFSACMVRRSVLLDCDMLSVPRPSCLDWWLWRQICFEHDVWCVHKRITKWRLHRTSYTIRENHASGTADGLDLTALMDSFLVRKHPAAAGPLLPFLRPEDRFSCEGGELRLGGAPVPGPRFSVVVPVISSDPPHAFERSLASLAAQTYSAFEVVLAGAGADGLLPAAEGVLRRPGAAGGKGAALRAAPCAGREFADALEAGFAAASGEWALLLLPGDELRPEALQTFAARAVLDPESDGFWAKARCRETDLAFAPIPNVPSGPFAAPGAFAFRLSLPWPPHSPLFDECPELRVLARAVSGRKAPYVNHVVALRDDSPVGRDPCARRLFASVAAFARERGDPPPPAPPAVLDDPASAIRRSPLFDGEWYLRENPDVLAAGMDPAVHYAKYGGSPDRKPCPDFAGDEYQALNPDVRAAGANPFAHWLLHGAPERRAVSFPRGPEPPFPADAAEGERDFPAPPADSASGGVRRVAVFAARSAAGVVPETTLHYLRGLREVCSDIVFVANNPLRPGEADKLSGLVRHALFRPHGGYDFLSWKLGIAKAEALGLLAPGGADELVLANDSCFGPVLPFPDSFGTMASRPCDFWGMTANRGFVGVEHLQSYFLVFRRRAFTHPAFSSFFRGVGADGDRWSVVRRCEARLTPALAEAGLAWDSLAPRDFAATHGVMPTKRPLALMRDHGVPLLKAKALAGDMADTRDGVVAFVRARAPALADLLPPPAPVPDPLAELRALRLAHPDSFAGKAARIAARAAAGETVRALFLVPHASMFPARPLFEAMRRDGAFDAHVFVVPDLRGLGRDVEAMRRACRADLAGTIPEEAFLDAAPDESGVWPDVIGDFGADIVCYPSPYDLSSFRYNPHWAVGRDFLPIHVNYGFYRSVYDRELMGRQNYADFWKAFFECDATAKEYAGHSIRKGANAEVVGYVKMDALATSKPWPRNGNRRRVLIAPHHSVEGGANDTLALSNFQRYADYFLSLPKRHPEIDFVFRPHPFLFTVLADPSRWGEAKVASWISRMKAHPNVRWCDEGDYFPAFASCDACIQDCGSYLVEWFYTGKPCCYLLKAPSDIDRKFAPLGKDCLSHCYLAYDEAAIESFLRDVVEGGADPKAAARDEFRKGVMVNYPHAADAALASIRRALGLA